MERLFFAKGEQAVGLMSQRLNRHGIIAGATGTGKTVTLKVLAEKMSEMGIPVFLSDVKGDLGSLAKQGEVNEKIAQRLERLGISDFEPIAYPVEFFDVLAEQGLPVRTTVSEIGPILLAQLLGLNDTQEGILNIAFKVADDEQLLLIDLKDLRAMLNEVGRRANELKETYGNITQQSIGAILRSLLVLEQQGGDLFFGEPSFDINDLLRQDSSGRGMISVLASEKLFLSPKLYATFLLWFLSELYENLPEVGDLAKPKLVFFFDEAHILFQHISPVVLDKVELIVRLIRSKGVGVFFVTQNPTDIPDKIASQLGNRIQHGLRAFTPKEQKNVKTIASTFRQETSQNLENLITQLAVGQAIVSYQQEDGSPSVAEVVDVYPPQSSLQVVDQLTRQSIINQSYLYAKYGQTVDRYSAYEQFEQLKQTQQSEKVTQTKVHPTPRASTQKDGVVDKFAKNLMSSIGREVGKFITRGILGMLKK